MALMLDMFGAKGGVTSHVTFTVVGAMHAPPLLAVPPPVPVSFYSQLLFGASRLLLAVAVWCQQASTRSCCLVLVGFYSQLLFGAVTRSCTVCIDRLSLVCLASFCSLLFSPLLVVQRACSTRLNQTTFCRVR